MSYVYFVASCGIGLIAALMGSAPLALCAVFLAGVCFERARKVPA